MFQQKKYFSLFAVIAVLFMAACNSTYTSKPSGYFRVELPEHKYVKFEQPGFPYSFEYPVYANIVQDSTYFDYNAENPYWRNIDFPQFNCKVFLSYKIIGGKSIYKKKQPDGTYKDSTAVNEFDKLVNDAFKLTYKNEVVSTGIVDSPLATPNGVHGLFFRVKGNAATARQFFLSDTSKHFLRGALYFYATPNADSVAPVLNFVQTDINHLINTFRWTER